MIYLSSFTTYLSFLSWIPIKNRFVNRARSRYEYFEMSSSRRIERSSTLGCFDRPIKRRQSAPDQPFGIELPSCQELSRTSHRTSRLSIGLRHIGLLFSQPRPTSTSAEAVSQETSQQTEAVRGGKPHLNWPGFKRRASGSLRVS